MSGLDGKCWLCTIDGNGANGVVMSNEDVFDVFEVVLNLKTERSECFTSLSCESLKSELLYYFFEIRNVEKGENIHKGQRKF